MKYLVTVEYTMLSRTKELTIYAKSESEAEDKACEIVCSWDGVDDASVIDVEEDE